MQETTGTMENVHTERRDIGPFTYNEVELIAKKAVNELGLKWDTLPIADRREFLDQAILVLTGSQTTDKMADGTKTGGDSKLQLEFRRIVLQEFKNSPKWDNDEFARGFSIKSARGAGTSAPQDESQSNA